MIKTELNVKHLKISFLIIRVIRTFREKKLESSSQWHETFSLTQQIFTVFGHSRSIHY